jgi:hypothetical protein
MQRCSFNEKKNSVITNDSNMIELPKEVGSNEKEEDQKTVGNLKR